MPRTSVGQSDLKLTNRAIKVASWKEGRSDTHPRPPRTWPNRGRAPPAHDAHARTHPRRASRRRRGRAGPAFWGDRRGHGPRRRGWVLLLPGRVAPPMRCRRPTFSSSFIYTSNNGHRWFEEGSTARLSPSSSSVSVLCCSSSPFGH